MSQPSVRILKSFNKFSVINRGFHRSLPLFEQPNIRWIAGSNKAPNYRKFDMTKKEEELEPEYIKNDTYRYRLLLAVVFFYMSKSYWRFSDFKFIRTEVELADFLQAENARLNQQ